MIELIPHIYIVIIPLIITNVFHMLVVKNNIFSSIALPIWKKGFGENKTWRGLIFITIVNGIFLLALNHFLTFKCENAFLTGLLLGFTYALSELPNSFIKRKVGIAAGETSSKFNIGMLTDKVDSALGVALVYVLLSGLTIKLGFILFVFNSIIHALFSYILVVLKVKKSF